MAEAVASMISDLPNKVVLTFTFNVPFYFLANLRRTPEAFFTFCVFAFAVLLTGSMIFRSLGAMSRTVSESVAPGAVQSVLSIIYTGFVVPIPYMRPWLRWFTYINPTAYAFESLMVNEVQSILRLSTNCSPIILLSLVLRTSVYMLIIYSSRSRIRQCGPSRANVRSIRGTIRLFCCGWRRVYRV
jgi:ABC-type multidrug transport system permease subunit